MAKKTKARKQYKEKMDAKEFEHTIFTEMTQDVINKLEELIASGDSVKWKSPWEVTNPANFISKKPYVGFNRVYLSLMGVRYIITQNQLDNWNIAHYGEDKANWKAKLKMREVVDKRTGKVRLVKPRQYKYVWYEIRENKNEENDTVTEEEEEERDTREKSFFEKYHFVFIKHSGYSIDDIEGIDVPEVTTHEHNNIPLAEKILDSSVCPIDYGGFGAYYSPSEDRIQLPKREHFFSSEEFYSVAFHEMTHSTGAEKRLGRKIKNKFGNKDYAREELTAELGSVMLCEKCGIANVTKDNSVAYLRGWIKSLKDDVRLLYKASNQAQKACDWIMNRVDMDSLVAEVVKAAM